MLRMRQSTARILLALAAAVSLVALPGCDDSRAHRTPGTIQVDIEHSPPSTDPRFATDAISSRVNELIFDPLVKADRNGEFANYLAESIERPSETEIVFHLRHGMRFSDGRELTLRDLKYTYNSVLAPHSLSPHRGGLERLNPIATPADSQIVMITPHRYPPPWDLA